MERNLTLTPLIQNLLSAALRECCDPAFVSSFENTPFFQLVIQAVREDLIAFSQKDPASANESISIAKTYSSFKAILHYRLAHAIWRLPKYGKDKDIESNALLISARGKLLSGAEIHHRCQVGQRFVLDHGVGTVIGETASIGTDCYILGGVTLGAVGIAGNPPGKRHPTVGDRVQIGAFARLFGAINVGDDVFIGPHCVIDKDVPSNSIVTVRSENQITRNVGSPCSVKPPIDLAMDI